MDIKTFWENSHNNKVLSDLSGGQYIDSIKVLKIESCISPGKHVLEVGVGLGYVVKGLYDNGIIVSALDISNVALERVKSYCEYVFTIDELNNLPSNYFDCIICANVIQHIPTDILIEELKHLIRSLKSDGVFAVEFVSDKKISDDSWSDQYKYPGRGLPGFVRSPKYLEKLIESVGGRCKMVDDIEFNAGANGCHTFHVRRRNNV